MKTHLGKLLLPLCLALVVSGCTSMAELDEMVAEYKGKHIQAAIAKLGYPHGERTVAGKKVYYWSDSRSGTRTAPQTSSTTQYHRGRRVEHTTVVYTTESYTYSCTIELAVDESEIVISHTLKGDVNGCQPYAKKLTAKKKI
jgi:hypothetical protein